MSGVSPGTAFLTHVEKCLYGCIQIIWEIRSKYGCCEKRIFSGNNLRILLEMLSIWQLLRILWAVKLGLFPGLISVLLPKCSCLSVHPALYRNVVEQTDSTGACRTVCNIQWPTSSVTKPGAPSASWVDLGNWKWRLALLWSQLWRRQMLSLRGLQQYKSFIRPQENAAFCYPCELLCTPEGAVFVTRMCWSTIVPANASRTWLAAKCMTEKNRVRGLWVRGGPEIGRNRVEVIK